MGVSVSCDRCRQDISDEVLCSKCAGNGDGGCDLAQCLHAGENDGCEKSAKMEHTGEFDSNGFPIFICKQYLRNMEALKEKVFKDAGRM